MQSHIHQTVATKAGERVNINQSGFMLQKSYSCETHQTPTTTYETLLVDTCIWHIAYVCHHICLLNTLFDDYYSN